MTGAMWAVVAGVGFGLFQSVNRRALLGMDVYQSTFLQLAISATVLILISLLTQDVGLLLRAPPSAWVNFSLAGLFHFFIGWTFLNASHKRIGASRTSPLIATNPLFAAFIAAATLREFPGPLAWVGILLIIGGVYVISRGRQQPGGSAQAAPAMRWQDIMFGLAAALCWAISPIFTRKGLEVLPSPLLGVSVGLAVSGIAYGALLLAQGRMSSFAQIPADAMLYKLAAGILGGFSTWNRWIALDLAPVAIVLALVLCSVPVVMFVSPLVAGRQLERVTPRVWSGAALVVGGVLFLNFFD
jgi:DME family drug/metabolite transporter